TFGLLCRPLFRHSGGMLARPVTIRQATPAHAPALRAIYAPHVEATPGSFEAVVPHVAAFAARIPKRPGQGQYPVAERDGLVVGYAYGSSHRERAAYQWSVEVSAYVDESCHRQGIGRALYQRLFDDLIGMGYCTAFAGITLPNDASVGLHRSVGFE